jgi:uncharacterized membrane protein YraQ (UPF0718 family)
MILILIDVLLWTLVAMLALAAAVRSRTLCRDAAREGVIEFIKLMPKLILGVIGSGYLAAVLPQAVLAQWLGPDSGLLGVTLATLGGALTPGGPVVGFSIGAAALKGGAGAPQVIAYSTAWALFAVHRLVMWELPFMSGRFVWLRTVASLPLPFLAALGAMLLGRP